jgi:hypothetical protein
MHPLEESWHGLKQQFDSAVSQSVRAARCQISNELNHCLRRLRQYREQAEWVSAVLDLASRFVNQIALFGVEKANLKLLGTCRLELPIDLSFAVSSAGAFADAIDSRDPVIALRTAANVSEHLSVADSAERAHIIPISNGARVVAILFAADDDYMDVNALELVGGIASLVLERHSNRELRAQIAPATNGHSRGKNGEASAFETNGTGEQEVSNSSSSLPSWADLTEEHRELHIQAQRFSRVTLAEMQLAKPEAFRAGREQANLYLFLKNEIDKARETYRTRFLAISSMLDYLHMELVHSAAEGDEMKLGAEYPGRLV